jgi:hypothetical protein
MYFLNQNETNYFFNQSDHVNKSFKRPKKQLNPQVLNKKLNNKFQTDDLLNDDTEVVETRTIASRLATLHPRQSVASMRESSAQISNSNQSRVSGPPNNPNAFTDTRLQAIRFLTDETIKQLEEYLHTFVRAEIVPILPGKIIYDWHADWSDLTEKSTYNDFPVWQTKNGLLRLGSSQRRSQMSNEDPNLNQTTNPSNSNSNKRLGKRNSIKPDDPNIEAFTEQTLRKANQLKLTKSPTAKLSSINEAKNDVALRNKHVSINSNKNGTSPIGFSNANNGGPLTTYATTGTVFKGSRNDSHSRLTFNASSLSGCLVNYQLSQPVYKEKGWTVVTISVDDRNAENQKKILNCLRNSLKNMYTIYFSFCYLKN